MSPLDAAPPLARRAPSERPGSPFGVADFVQLAGMGRHSVVIDITWARGRGLVVVREGQVIAAADERGRGLEALRRLVFATKPQVSCRGLRTSERFERNIEGSCESVLLEVARVQDEVDRAQPVDEASWDELLAAIPGASPGPTASDLLATACPPRPDRGPPKGPLSEIRPVALAWMAPPPLPADTEPAPPAAPPSRPVLLLSELLDEGVDALLAKNYRRAYEAFRSAANLAPEDPTVRANLTRLQELGYGP